MGLINRLHTFATMPGISPDIGAKIDAELNTLFNAVNGNLDNTNISGNPDIESSKLSLGGAGYLPLAGGSLTSVLNHAFNGLWRTLGATGTGLIREYRYGNTVWGIAYNTLLDTNGNWQGRDISDICLRVELTKTSDGWGGLRVYTADSLGGGATPVWNPVQHYEPMGGHSRYSSGGAWSSFVGDETITVDPGVSGIFHYNNLTLNSEWTLEQGKPLIIFARESVTINVTGIINGNRKGSPGTITIGGNALFGGSGGGGGSQVGVAVGYNGGSSTHYWTVAGGTAQMSTGDGDGNPGNNTTNKLTHFPSGGVWGGASGGAGCNANGSYGMGGNGGGFVCIEAPIIVINTGASITCEGENGMVGNNGSGVAGGGGGGGGVIWLRGKSIINNGTYSVIGGIGGNGFTIGEGGNGGAGVIYIEEYR